jgi:hypothetical protein
VQPLVKEGARVTKVRPSRCWVASALRVHGPSEYLKHLNRIFHEQGTWGAWLPKQSRLLIQREKHILVPPENLVAVTHQGNEAAVFEFGGSIMATVFR